MKFIKAFLFIGAFLCVSACFTSCSKKAEDKSDKLTIVTTIFPQYDFVRQIAGDKVSVSMLLKPGAEAHSYEPTPQDMKTIQKADLFIYVGGENDEWVEDLLSSFGDKRPRELCLLDCVSVLDEEIVEGMEHEHHHEEGEEHHHDDDDDDDEHHHEEGEEHHHHHDEEEDEHEIDEHVWTSPKNAGLIVDAITGILCEIDSKNASFYRDNASSYKAQLDELDAQFREIVNTASRKTVLFADRFPFRYLANEYGLSYYAAFTGCSTETEASAATVAFLINKTKEEKLPVVFTIEFSNGKIADSVCDASGAKKMVLHSCHTLSADDLKNGKTYLSVMKENAAALKAALN